MNKRTLALNIAEELLVEIEQLDDSIINILLKIKRMTLLLGDNDGRTWIDLEITGYPNKFFFDKLGNCKKYAVQSGRINIDTNKYYTQSLPEFEANAALNDKILNGIKLPNVISPSVSSSNQYERPGDAISGAIKNTMTSHYNFLEATKKNTIFYINIFNSIKNAIHNYIIDTYLSLKFGDINEQTFEFARDLVDKFIRTECPKAIEQLVAANDAMRQNSSEYYSQALTTCRRLLFTIADTVYPARNIDYVDRKGKNRKVGIEEYKNRLLAYLESNSNIIQDNQLNEIEFFASKLDIIYEKTCKGVHAEITNEEANLTLIHIYLIIAEIAKVFNFNKISEYNLGIPTTDLN